MLFICQCCAECLFVHSLQSFCFLFVCFLSCCPIGWGQSSHWVTGQETGVRCSPHSALKLLIKADGNSQLCGAQTCAVIINCFLLNDLKDTVIFFSSFRWNVSRHFSHVSPSSTSSSVVLRESFLLPSYKFNLLGKIVRLTKHVRLPFHHLNSLYASVQLFSR